MMIIRRHTTQIILGFFLFFIFFCGSSKLYSKEIYWTVAAKTDNEIQFIDTNSIKYNNNGLLSVSAKYSEVNPDDQSTINVDTFLFAIDCKNRLFSKLPINSELKLVKKWEKPINNKLIKRTIINSCSY